MRIGDGSIDTAITVLGAFKCAINKTGQINVREENEKEINGYIDMAIDALKKQPKIGGWIPCSEKLPEEKGWYLVYAKNQRPFVAYFKGKTFPLNNHYHEIVAWMPLPEPYEEKENG